MTDELCWSAVLTRWLLLADGHLLTLLAGSVQNDVLAEGCSFVQCHLELAEELPTH